MLSAFVQILLFVVAALVVNGFVYYYGWAKTGSSPVWKLYQNRLVPPGFAIGVFWIAIFGFLGYAHYLLVKNNDGNITVGSMAIIVYGIFALSYPLLTWGALERNAYVVNYLGVVLGFVVALIVISEFTDAFFYLLPLLIWVSYVVLSDSIMHRNYMVRQSLKEMKPAGVVMETKAE
jgi:tryptophan-rich sensory protein